MKETIVTGNLPLLWRVLNDQLSSRGYCSESIRHYRETMVQLDYFMRESHICNYSADVGKLFLERMRERKKKPKQYCITRLNDVLHGKEFTTLHSHKAPRMLRTFSDLYRDFVADLKCQGLQDSTQKLQSFYCLEFLLFLEDHNISDVTEINSRIVYDAISCSNSQTNLCLSIRKFLKFIFVREICSVDLSPFVPRIRRPKPVPSIYSPSELSEMIQVADLDTSKGMRDYAILLLAARLGMRVSDICNLELTDIHREKGTVEFVQRKTQVPITLALLPDVRAAIDVYISKGRPQTKSTKVFIRTISPYIPIGRSTVAHITKRYFAKTTVDTTGKKCGPHSLRMSLATELVAENVSYAIVQKVLGHQNALCFNNYVRLDMEKLRQCALEVPAATGSLKTWLYGRNDGGQR